MIRIHPEFEFYKGGKASVEIPLSEAVNMSHGAWVIFAQDYKTVHTQNVTISAGGGDTLTWDGNTHGLVNVSDLFYKVSDAIPTMDDCANGGSCTMNGEVREFASGEVVESNLYGFGAAYIISVAPLTWGEFIFPETGVYFLNAPGTMVCTSITIHGYTGFPSGDSGETSEPVDGSIKLTLTDEETSKFKVGDVTAQIQYKDEEGYDRYQPEVYGRCLRTYENTSEI